MKPATAISAVAFSLSATATAGLLAICAGIAMARIVPADKHSWAALATLPLWIFLELFLESVVEVFGGWAKYVRIAVGIAVLLGFYGAWFVVRSL